jgi:hypothetical protein
VQRSCLKRLNIAKLIHTSSPHEMGQGAGFMPSPFFGNSSRRIVFTQAMRRGP